MLERASGRHVGDHRVEQRRPHRGYANAPALVALEKTVLDQAPDPVGIDQAAAHLFKRPRIDAFA